MQEVQEEEPIKLTYLDFKILNEKWSTYKVEDGTILKARVMMVSYAIVMNPKLNQANFMFALHTVFGVESPHEIRGPADSTTSAASELMQALEPAIDDLNI